MNKKLFTSLSFVVVILILLSWTGGVAGGEAAVPVFVKPAVLVEKEFTLVMYGNFTSEDVTTIYSPIPGLIKDVRVKTGDKAAKNKVLFTVYRDDPGFTKQEKQIKAPFTCIIDRLQAYEGTRISPQTPVMVVSAFDPLYFYAYTAEENMKTVRLHDTLEIEVSYLDQPVKGTVVNILAVDRAKQMSPIKIRVANRDNRIAAGSEGKIRYTYDKKTVVVIPAEAVQVEKGRYFAWVKEDGRAAKKEIRTGELTEKGIECLSGISAGEEVIYYGYLDLKPGDLVKAVESTDGE